MHNGSRMISPVCRCLGVYSLSPASLTARSYATKHTTISHLINDAENCHHCRPPLPSSTRAQCAAKLDGYAECKETDCFSNEKGPGHRCLDVQGKDCK